MPAERTGGSRNDILGCCWLCYERSEHTDLDEIGAGLLLGGEINTTGAPTTGFMDLLSHGMCTLIRIKPTCTVLTHCIHYEERRGSGINSKEPYLQQMHADHKLPLS